MTYESVEQLRRSPQNCSRITVCEIQVSMQAPFILQRGLNGFREVLHDLEWVRKSFEAMVIHESRSQAFGY